MPPRTTPTERQKRLGAELRKMRMAAGASADYAARLLGIDRTKISNIESGVRAITPERVRTLATNYACTDEDYIAALMAMASERARGWWERFRGSVPAGMLDIAELEWHAVRVRTSQIMHLPGLFQTESYARAIFDAVLPALPRLEVELHVAHRMQRQQVLERNNPLEYVGYMHEAALRMQFGGRKVLLDQLNHLLLMSERENVPQLDTVELDSAGGPRFEHAESQLARYRAHLDWMERAALDQDRSRDFIQAIAREL